MLQQPPIPPPQKSDELFVIQDIAISDPYMWMRQNLYKYEPSRQLAKFIRREQQYHDEITDSRPNDMIDILVGRMDALPARKNHPAPPSLPQPVTTTPADIPHKISKTVDEKIVDYKAFEKFEDVSPTDDPDDIRRLPSNYGDYFFRANNKILIYSLDDQHGREEWQIIIHDETVRNEKKHKRIVIPRTSQDFAVDNAANVYFIRPNEIGRGQFLCVRMHNTGEIYELMNEEVDPTIDLRIELSTDENFAFIYRERTQTSQIFGIDLRHSSRSIDNIRKNELKILTPFEIGTIYRADFSDGYIYWGEATRGDITCIMRTKTHELHRIFPSSSSLSSKSIRNECVYVATPGFFIQSFWVIANNLLILEISRGFTQVIWYDKNNLKSRVSLSSSSSSDLRYRLPFEDPAFNIAIYPKYVDWKNHTIDIEYSSPRVPTSYYKFKWASSSSLKHNTDNMKIIEIVGGLTNKFDSALYTSKMGFATSKDGIKIPYITVARRDIHPRSKSAEDCAEIVAAASATDIGVNARGLLICGYGSYGMLLSLNFTPWISYLIDRGFVFCGAMIRGGGECGFSWYEEGRNTAKQTTVDDFVTVTREMQRIWRCGPERTVAFGRSAGGFLMGILINQYPELYNVIYMQSPFLNPLVIMSDYQSPLTFQELDEFGDPKVNLTDFVNLVKLDPIINIIAKNKLPTSSSHKCFPNVVIEIGINDRRTEPSESMRWVAYSRLYKHPNSCDGRKSQIILNIDHDCGHFSNSNKFIEAEKNARSIHFILSKI